MSSAANLDKLLEALAPDPSKTSFPAPRLVRGSGPAGVFTYESLTLSGQSMPGQWLLVDCTRVFGWQIQKLYGQTGATLLPIGDDPIVAKFAIRIWASTDAANYRMALRSVLKKPVNLVPGSTATAGMGIEQPQLNDMGVKAVVVKSVTPLINPLVTSGGRGPWTAACEFYEYRPPLAALPKPNQQTPDRSPSAPSAQDLLDTENARLANTFSAKAAALALKFSGGPKP